MFDIHRHLMQILQPHAQQDKTHDDQNIVYFLEDFLSLGFYLFAKHSQDFPVMYVRFQRDAALKLDPHIFLHMSPTFVYITRFQTYFLQS